MEDDDERFNSIMLNLYKDKEEDKYKVNEPGRNTAIPVNKLFKKYDYWRTKYITN